MGGAVREIRTAVSERVDVGGAVDLVEVGA